ncbi:MAG: dephospho-CoA kinase [Ignavibacteriae bacterium]|nr:dephospho-CoA kinase [Ignavibacteriota bacterium]
MEKSAEDEHQAILVGITGGIGSGKSTVSDMIEMQNFTVLNADIFAAVLMETKAEIRSKLFEFFGGKIFRDDGMVNRDYLASRVFGEEKSHKEALKKLNMIVHPFVLDELLTRAEALASEGETCIFIEVPLLYEIGLEDAFDYVILVIAPDNLRVKRVMERSELTEEQIRARMEEQAPPEHMKAIADFVIDNSGTVEKLQQSVDFLLSVIPLLPPKEPDDEDDVEEST